MNEVPFVVIEGLDGSGKTTQANLLVQKFRDLGFDPLFIHFPDKNTVSGKLIYQHLAKEWGACELNGSAEPDTGSAYDYDLRNAKVFQALQTANRMERVGDIVKALQEGRPVVLDRYWHSGYAYGVADGLDGDHIVSCHSTLPQPGIAFLLDMPVHFAIDRMVAAGRTRDRYEDRRELLERVRSNYLDLWRRGLKFNQTEFTLMFVELEPAATIHATIWADVSTRWPTFFE